MVEVAKGKMKLFTPSKSGDGKWLGKRTTELLVTKVLDYGIHNYRVLGIASFL